METHNTEKSKLDPTLVSNDMILKEIMSDIDDKFDKINNEVDKLNKKLDEAYTDLRMKTNYLIDMIKSVRDES